MHDWIIVLNNPVNDIDPYGLSPTLVMRLLMGGPACPGKTDAQKEADRQLANSLEDFVENWFSQENLLIRAKMALSLIDPRMAPYLTAGKNKKKKENKKRNREQVKGDIEDLIAKEEGIRNSKWGPDQRKPRRTGQRIKDRLRDWTRR